MGNRKSMPPMGHRILLIVNAQYYMEYIFRVPKNLNEANIFYMERGLKWVNYLIISTKNICYLNVTFIDQNDRTNVAAFGFLH